MSSFSAIIAAILPFLLWPVEMVLPYPAMIEESAKFLLLYSLARQQSPLDSRYNFLIVGFFFALTESVLFLYNIHAAGGRDMLILRLILTIPLHVVTSYVSISFVRKTRFLGLLCAIAIHAVYNHYIPLLVR